VGPVELRYALAVVTGAGSDPGRDVAVALSRRGAAVLAVDPDLAAAEETVALVRRARVTGWAHQGGTDDETDVRLLAARALDLGGADVVVDAAPGAASDLLESLLRDALDLRRGVRRDPGAVVRLGRDVALGANPTDTCREVLDALT
jgi:NAD(P)-dependent dehydrogenase (short-subunit alcohol dehydrogenase family)